MRNPSKISCVRSLDKNLDYCFNDCAFWKQLTPHSHFWTSRGSRRPGSIPLFYLMPLAQNKSDFTEQKIFSEGCCLPSHHTHQKAAWEWKSKLLLMGIQQNLAYMDKYQSSIFWYAHLFIQLSLSGPEAERRSQLTLLVSKKKWASPIEGRKEATGETIQWPLMVVAALRNQNLISPGKPWGIFRLLSFSLKHNSQTVIEGYGCQ